VGYCAPLHGLNRAPDRPILLLTPLTPDTCCAMPARLPRPVPVLPRFAVVAYVPITFVITEYRGKVRPLFQGLLQRPHP
jgi:hypothetical protein